MLRQALFLLTFGFALLMGGLASAQQDASQSWVQIEAKPSQAEAEDRARAWTALFDNVAGFAVTSGWHVISLGPYTPAEAAARLAELRDENLIPRDSFVSDGETYRTAFWPAAGLPEAPETAPEAAAEAVPDDITEAPPEVAAADPAPAPEPDETAEQAQQSEASLSQSERELLQTALRWFGHYNSTIDGAFGRGTRAAMTEWQDMNGFDTTGILTTLQRGTLVANYQAEQAAFGFATLTEPEAGIEVTLPLSLVVFDHYEPPFVHFIAKDGSDTRITLISQPGDQAALYALYDMLQTLEIMPTTGPRDRGERSFSLRGDSAAVASQAYAELSRGLIKGWIVTWNPATDVNIDRVIQTVEASFRPIGDRALDPGIVPMSDTTKAGLLSGLEVRKPRLSRSGFYIDTAGTVLTTAEAVAQCARITLDGTVDARVTLSDPASGLAVLTPATPLSPASVAEFQLAPDRIGAEIAVAGYSYGEALPAPVLTFGTLQAAEGLQGEAGLKRLALAALPGDQGGPVLDNTGAVLGMLLPPSTDPARVLPAGVAFAAAGASIATALQAKGITLSQSSRSGGLPPEDLAKHAGKMTVLVSCWE